MIWRLKKTEERRVRSGHPWVFSNELQGSPKGVKPGEWVELHDAKGDFLAWGGANPNSLIALRIVTRDRDTGASGAAAAVRTALDEALKFRVQSGLTTASFRLCNAESDGLPGLTVDRFLLEGADRQVFVVQPQTAGADQWVPIALEWLQANAKIGGCDWSRTAVVLRADAKIRALEGIEVAEEPKLLHGEKWTSAEGLRNSMIAVRAVISGGEKPLVFSVDLWAGQKTGFFLDQSANINLAWTRGQARMPKGEIKILDLFSYVGQWSVQLANALRAQGHSVRVLTVDASAQALERAKVNCERVGARWEGLKLDIVESLKDFENPAWAKSGFDWVIVDPPALIKNRKSIPQGKHAYQQINANAARHLTPNGMFVSCSCSSLFEEGEFVRMLARTATKASGALRFVGRGGPAMDHPLRMEFPEGHYLKCWIGAQCSK